jgi:toxin ParE1/3/4
MKIVCSPRAIRHLTALRSYIEKDSETYAGAVADRILHVVGLLAKQPEMGRPERIFGTRELVVAGTPFLVAYRIRRERLEIIAILHGRQKWPDAL